MVAAFERLHDYARGHDRRLGDVAQDVVDGAVDVGAVVAAAGEASPYPQPLAPLTRRRRRPQP
jgi:hypothetical protein